MKIKTMLASFAFLINGISLVSAQEATQADANETRTLRSAERVIIMELTRGKSLLVRSARENKWRTCPVIGGSTELAIDLIGIGKSDATADALVDLLALRLDAAGGEGLSCQILIRGRALLSRLERLNARPLVERCHATFHELKKRETSYITDVTVEQICRTEEEILKRRDLMLEGIRADVPCPLY